MNIIINVFKLDRNHNDDDNVENKDKDDDGYSKDEGRLQPPCRICIEMETLPSPSFVFARPNINIIR